jgi:hypothetical protein
MGEAALGRDTHSDRRNPSVSASIFWFFVQIAEDRYVHEFTVIRPSGNRILAVTVSGVVPRRQKKLVTR